MQFLVCFSDTFLYTGPASVSLETCLSLCCGLTLCNLNFVQLTRFYLKYIVWSGCEVIWQSFWLLGQHYDTENCFAAKLTWYDCKLLSLRKRAVVSWLLCNSALHCTAQSTDPKSFSHLQLGDSDNEVALFRTRSSSLCITPGTSIELMMPHEDERTVPEEKLRFSTNRRITVLKQYHRQHSAVQTNSETGAICGCIFLAWMIWQQWAAVCLM